MFSLTRKRDEKKKKESLINIENEKDFVINYVTKQIFPQLYQSSFQIPFDQDKFDLVQ